MQKENFFGNFTGEIFDTTGMQSQRGWSLLETLICIVLSASLAWAAIPRPGTTQLNTDARLLAEVLRGIRHRAIAERREFTVSYQSGVCSVAPAQGGLAGLCRRLLVRHPGQITFHSNGVTSPATLLLNDGGDYACTVAVSLRGRVRVSCSSAGNGR